MNSILRITCAVNRVSAANPCACYEHAADLLSQLPEEGSDIILFPSMALCPPSTGSLLKNPCMAEQCEKYLDELCAISQKMDCYVIAGLVKDFHSRLCRVCAVIHQGCILGYLPEGEEPIPGFDELLPPNTVFRCNDLTFSILPGDPVQLPRLLPAIAANGCQAVLCPSYEPVTAEYLPRAASYAKALSDAFGIGLVLCNGGVGDTSCPNTYRGFCEIYECGQLLGTKDGDSESFFLSCDLDTDIIRSQQIYQLTRRPDFAIEVSNEKRKLLRAVSPSPFLPNHPQKLGRIFDLQVKSLAARMSNTGLNKLVVGVSGGLDSTLALLVCQKALEHLELPPQNLVGITMPGFGTSDRTYFNALSLISALGGQNRDISIKSSVLQHFEDIGHDPSVKDVTYENAQARERTQILMDIANSCRGLVVGTGDMSEAALGWCTFNGDHMASYNVNICIPKTVVRRMVTHLSHSYEPNIGSILRDIVDTPVSPELLPPDESGKIAQKTEDILGSYDLHDFFLYYLLKYNLRPQKLFYYACLAFSGVFAPVYIKDKLKIFISRFFSGQFKRSCAPDSAKITDLCLADYQFPSDCSSQTMLSQLDNIVF